MTIFMEISETATYHSRFLSLFELCGMCIEYKRKKLSYQILDKRKFSSNEHRAHGTNEKKSLNYVSLYVCVCVCEFWKNSETSSIRVFRYSNDTWKIHNDFATACRSGKHVLTIMSFIFKCSTKFGLNLILRWISVICPQLCVVQLN